MNDKHTVQSGDNDIQRIGNIIELHAMPVIG